MSDALRDLDAIDALLNQLRATLTADATSRPRKAAPPEDPLLIAELRRDEGVKRYMYLDHLGFASVGVGRLIDQRRGGGLSDDEVDYLLANDIAKVKAGLDRAIPWWRGLDPVRQRVLQNMGHQLGIGGVMNFRKFLAHAKAGRWAKAAAEMLDSSWAREQTPERAARLAQMMKTGETP